MNNGRKPTLALELGKGHPNARNRGTYVFLAIKIQKFIENRTGIISGNLTFHLIARLKQKKYMIMTLS